jgi:hypothetical protein
MKLGTIKADNLLSWTPDEESAEGFTRWATSPNGIVLAKYSLLYQATVVRTIVLNAIKLLLM